MVHPRDREALDQAVVRGSELLKQGKNDHAQLAFRQALALEPDNPRVLALLALSYFRGNAFGEARAIYEQLVERTPTDASHRLNLGVVYLKLSDADRAIAALEASRALDPSQGRAISYLGLAYARAGRYAEAYRAFLLAGQNDLAIEIEANLPAAERDRIHSQLGRTPHGPLPEVDPTPGPTSGPTPGPTSGPDAGARPPAPPVTRTPAAGVPAPRMTPAAGVPVPRMTPAVGVPVPRMTPLAGVPVQRSPAPLAGTSRPPAPPTATLRPPAPVPVAPARAQSEPQIARTLTPNLIPRTRPPGAPPAKSRTPSQEFAVPAAPEPREPREPHGPPARVAPRPATLASSAEAAAGDVPAVARTVTPGGTARFTDSMQFVVPRAEPAAPREMLDGASMISRAVASAAPSATAGLRTRSGGTPPRPLSELATEELVRPDEGDDVFEIGPGGALIIRVTERVLTRLDGVHVTGGDLGYEPAMRRSRGHNTEEVFAHGGSQLHAVTGRGYLIAVAGPHAFGAVSLDDDILYLREDLVFAFQAQLRWENGNVPGLRGKLPLVQFRGDGAVALRLARPLVRVKLAQGTVFVDADRLAGWIGRVIPRAVVPPPGGPLGAMCVECTGEGIVLVEPAGDDPLAARAAPGQRSPAVAAASGPAPADRAARPERREGGAAPSSGDPDSGDPIGRLDEL